MKKLMIFTLIILINIISCITLADTHTLINLDFQQIPIKNILEMFAKMQHKNIIISDAVNGTITIHLENVTWQNALDLILKEQGLVAEKSENVLFILPIDEMTSREEKQQAYNNLLPVQSKTIVMRYAKAQDIVNTLKNQNKSLLSPRGNITADIRTNSIWVEDIPEKLNSILEYIQHIDVPVKQVLIEARIVTIDQKYEKELGVRFGLTRPGNNLSGHLTGANQLANNFNPAQADPLSRLNVDLPTHTSNAGSIALGLASLGGGNLLDLELSALETEGVGKIISSPRLVTADQQSASILSGQEIPYQQSANYGATSIAFQKAVLSLIVTPQITPSNQLLLSLQVNQDRPGAAMVHGVPEIDTREIKTQVLVKNGQTLVLGGIYEQNQNQQTEKIPFFGDLPIMGKLFQHNLKQNNRRELLIFVTPYIVEQR